MLSLRGHAGCLAAVSKGVIKMLLNVYLCGWVVTTIGTLVAVNRLPDCRRPHLLAALAGSLWPVLVVGVIELVAIVVLARSMRTAGVRHARQAAMERYDELTFSTDL
jgi:hypothetical protein